MPILALSTPREWGPWRKEPDPAWDNCNTKESLKDAQVILDTDMKTPQEVHLELMKAALVGLSTPATAWYNRKLNLIPPGQAAKRAREIADAALSEYLNRWE